MDALSLVCTVLGTTVGLAATAPAAWRNVRRWWRRIVRGEVRPPVRVIVRATR
jgi:hypothetical protein